MESVKELHLEIEKLKREIHKLKFENSMLKVDLSKFKKGGRKAIDHKTREEIKKSREENMTITDISKLYKVSVGVVHKIINEK